MIICPHCRKEFVFWHIENCEPNCKINRRHRYCPNCKRYAPTIKELEQLLSGY